MSAESSVIEPKSPFEFLVDAKMAVERTTTRVKIRQSHLANNDVDDPSTNRVLELMEGVEAEIDDMIVGPLQNHPAWKWFSRINGIGNENVAKVLGPLNIHRALKPSSFWKYAGMHVINVPVSRDQQWQAVQKSLTGFTARLAELQKKYKTPEAEAEKIQVLNTANITSIMESLMGQSEAGLESRIQGFAPTRAMYKATGQKLDYNSQLRVMCFRLAGALLKSGIRYFCVSCGEQRPPKDGAAEAPACAKCGSKEYRSKPTSKFAEFYMMAKDREVAKLQGQGIYIVPTLELPKYDGKIFEPVGTISSNHVHMRAQREMMKLWLALLHRVWREELGLPASLPYAHGIQGHSPATMINPYDMVDRPEPKKKVIRPIKPEPQTPSASES